MRDAAPLRCFNSTGSADKIASVWEDTEMTKHRETYHRKEDLDHEIKELEANFELFHPKFD